MISGCMGCLAAAALRLYPTARHMSPREAEVVARLVVYGQQNHEIARALGVSLGTVNVLAHRARNRLGLTGRSGRIWLPLAFTFGAEVERHGCGREGLALTG